MGCLVLTFLALGFVGADQNLASPARLESEREIERMVLSPDGKTLFAAVRDGKGYHVVAWDVRRKSKTILSTRASLEYFCLAPDGMSLVVCTAMKCKEDSAGSDAELSILGIRTSTMTALRSFRRGLLLAIPEFSRDGTLLAIADGNEKKVYVWKRDAAAKWSVSKVMDMAQPQGTKEGYRAQPVFTPDGTQLFVLSLFGFQKWDTLTGGSLHFPITRILPEVTMTGEVLFLVGDKTFCIQSVGAASEINVDEVIADTSYLGALGVQISSGKRIYNLPVLLTGASISPDGRTGASVAVDWTPAGGPRSHFPAIISFWNFDDGTRLRQVTVPEATGQGGVERPFGIFSPDSRFFVMAAGDAAHHVHVIDVNKAGTRSSLKMGDRVIEIEKAEVTSTFAVDAPIKGLFRLNSGEIAAVGVEPKAILIWKIKMP